MRMKNIKVKSTLLALSLVTFLPNHSVVHAETISQYQDGSGGVIYEKHDLPETLSLVEEMVNKAIEQKSLDYYNEAYNAVMKLYDEENKKPLLDRLASIKKEVFQGEKADTATEVTGMQLADSTVKKITGNYHDISYEVSKAGWDKADSVVLVSSVNTQDFLYASALASQLNVPILFSSESANLDKYNYNPYLASVKYSSLRENIDKNNAKILRLGAKKVYIIGGEDTISKQIEYSIPYPWVEVVRLQGADKFETAVAVGQEEINKSKSTTAFLSNADDFADMLAGATYAGKQGSPILLTEQGSLNETTKKALVNWGIKDVFILGGTGVVSEQVGNELKNIGISIVRLDGADRYDTSKKITEYFNKEFDKCILVSGKVDTNALVASSFGRKINRPVILMDIDCSAETKNFVKDKDFVIVGDDLYEDAIRNPVSISYYQKDGMTFSTLNDMPVLSEADVKNDSEGSDRYRYFKNHQEDWICPQIKSSATDNNVTDFKTLGNELDMNYETTYASYSVYHNPHLDAFSLSNIGNTYNSEFMMQIKVWSGDRSNILDYRIQPMAKQVFKFYFGSASDDMFNKVNTIYKGSDAEYKALINHKFTVGDREVYFQEVIVQESDSVLQIFVSRPGEKLNK
jgi:putative cell wall-binding protein